MAGSYTRVMKKSGGILIPPPKTDKKGKSGYMAITLFVWK